MENDFCFTSGNILKVVSGTFRDFVQKQKTNLEFQRIFDNTENISLPKSFLKALTIFLAIYQSQRKHSRLVLQKTLKKKLCLLFMDGVQLSEG